MQQINNVFESRVLFAGSLLGSIYVGSATGSGTQGRFLYDPGSTFGSTGSADFRMELRCLSGGSPSTGSHFIAFDNIKQFVGGSQISMENFTALTFDGSNELEVEMIHKVV